MALAPSAMAQLSSQLTLFGLDLTSSWAKVRQLITQLPLLRSFERCVRPSTVLWLTTDAPDAPDAPAQHSEHPEHPLKTAWLRADQWLGYDEAAPTAPAAAPTHAALLVDADVLLHRRLQLPLLTGQELDAAVQLQALAFSPFVPEDLVCTYRAQPNGSSGLDVELVLASRKMLENACQQAVSSYQLKSNPELWLPIAQQPPVLCPGWGEGPRLQQERRQRLGLIAAALAVLALVGALALTPSLKLLLQLRQAHAQTTALAQQTQAVAAQRQHLMAQAQELHALMPQLQQQIDHLRVLAALTRVLPDDTATQSIAIEGTHLSVQGLSANASQVQQLLVQEPGFHSVRMPSAITRDSNTKLENFAIEADLDPQVFAVWPVPASSTPSAHP